jgi:hypothetical protein
MIDQAAFRLRQKGKKPVKGCTHNIRDYIPLVQIWRKNFCMDKLQDRKLMTRKAMLCQPL